MGRGVKGGVSQPGEDVRGFSEEGNHAMDAYVVVDLEMTGLNPKRDRILEIGAVKVKQGLACGTFQQMVNPRMDLPEEIAKLTGITSEMAQEGCGCAEAVRGFLEFAEGFPLAGHNLIYDFSFLKQAAVNRGIELHKEGIDTLKLARKFLPDAERKSLDYLCEILHIDHGRKHRALDDAEATARLLWYLWETFGDKEPQEFEAKPLHYKVKKQQPASERQKRRLKELAEYHRIDIGRELDSLTRSEASRMTDKIIFSCGRITK